MTNSYKLGRRISYILRHHPESIGAVLDPHGWINTEELIAGITKENPEFSMELLEKIVETDNKQRYSFNEDKTKIRANQGHSIPVDIELEEKEPPEYLYHGTAEKYLVSIAEQGLLPQNRLYVHLSESIETARKVGSRHGEPIVLQVHAGQMFRDGQPFFLSANNVWLVKSVPVRYLEKLE